MYSKDEKNLLWIIAHRGARQEAPENTRAAFDKALNYPIDGIETDVQLTKDEIPVLFHDRTLFKIRRTGKRICDYTLEELRQWDWGKWFSSEYSNESLLTLGETLSFYAHRTRFLIEIKSEEKDRRSGRSFILAEKVLHELENAEIQNYLENICILSFDPDVLKFAHEKVSGLKYVLNLSNSRNDLTGYQCILQQSPADIDHLYGLCVEQKYLSKNLADYAQKYRKCLMTYSCNNIEQLQKALALNVDVVMTDNPQWLTTYLIKNKPIVALSLSV